MVPQIVWQLNCASQGSTAELKQVGASSCSLPFALFLHYMHDFFFIDWFEGSDILPMGFAAFLMLDHCACYTTCRRVASAAGRAAVGCLTSHSTHTHRCGVQTERVSCCNGMERNEKWCLASLIQEQRRGSSRKSRLHWRALLRLDFSTLMKERVEERNPSCDIIKRGKRCWV